MEYILYCLLGLMNGYIMITALNALERTDYFKFMCNYGVYYYLYLNAMFVQTKMYVKYLYV
jgi:hypothetical protein